jgi:hypothetical protein
MLPRAGQFFQKAAYDAQNGRPTSSLCLRGGVLTSGTWIVSPPAMSKHSLLLEDFDVLIVQPEKDRRN